LWQNTSVVIIITFGLFYIVHCFENVDSFDVTLTVHFSMCS